MKNERQLRILEILQQQTVKTQEELTKILIQEGFRVTQATVSRDIRELHLRKAQNAKGEVSYVMEPASDAEKQDTQNKYERVLRHVLVSAEAAANIAVLKTLSGTAGAAGAALETMPFTDLVGTLAGDDTLLCIFADQRKALFFCRVINSRFIHPAEAEENL